LPKSIEVAATLEPVHGLGVMGTSAPANDMAEAQVVEAGSVLLFARQHRRWRSDNPMGVSR
jgi:hypothetical protein